MIIVDDEFVLNELTNGSETDILCRSKITEKYILKNCPEVLDYMKNRFDDTDENTSLYEIAYRIQRKIEHVPRCAVCNKPIPFNSGYNKRFCSKTCETSEVGNVIKHDNIKKTLQERFGGNSAFCSKEIREKSVRTLQERYGEEYTNAFQVPKLKDKIKQTHIDQYGSQENYYATIKEHSNDTIKKRRKYFGMSKIEKETYRFLTSIFSIDGVIYNSHIDKRYNYAVDFYIPSLDLFIEINGHWSHYKHQFNKNDENDIKILKEWTEKAKHSYHYACSIEVWTNRDPMKIEAARKSNIHYLPIWYNKINVVIAKIKKYTAEHNLILPEQSYSYTDEDLFNIKENEELYEKS